jgi:hypothetical protein
MAKGAYAGRSGGKVIYNGGFSGMPTISLAGLPDDWYERVFGKKEEPQEAKDESGDNV